ncbi:MAG: type ISP restriction/modification enzyme [Deltaproteobacteria bacterium]|nr:type ISP restriction/modification enzyme [Deltaproteobacteria bacterium]
MQDNIKNYLKSIEQALSAGNATEHTFRPALKELIESLETDITAINEPKRIACGAPDYIIMKGDVPLGYIEAKDIGKRLDEVEKSEQMARYLQGLGNLILTDYLEFRWYAEGKHRLTARLAKVDAKGKLQIDKEGTQQFFEQIDSFFNNLTPTIGTPKELAVRMAALAHIIRDTIGLAFESEEGGGALHQQMEAFRKVLLHDLTKGQFADMYAQTICYGLFAARCNVSSNPRQPGEGRSEGRFTRQHAAYELPKTNPFLRKMFGHIAGPDLDERITWAVDDLAELLNRADIEAILRNFGKRTRQEDPVVHFYETFLSAYDPRMREARGVYYTPEPVVSYIVRSVDHILKTDFKIQAGLADTSTVKIPNPDGKGKTEVHKVLVLDPATGTGTFLHGVIDHIHESFAGNKGMWSGYVSQHLLPRIFGFELLMAPYAVAHMKLGLQLAETGYDFATDERLKVFLTNTLEEVYKFSNLPLLASWLAEEANAAGNIKQDSPVMVVMGNPPYSYESENTGEWITGLIRDYYQIDGQPLGERNPKGLQDDYVKFIRFAQWRIEKTGYGILAFITNHGYLDNPTFRGMRKSLMDTFDDIYILNLHGNSKKKEKCPDGSKDENVFDIQQGVAIGIFVKRQGNKSVRPEPFNTVRPELVEGDSVHGSTGSPRTECAKVRHADLWGQRKDKYAWLSENELSGTEWTTVKPQEPHYLFVPQDAGLLEEYEQERKVTELFKSSANGFKTHRDHVAIAWTQDDIKALVTTFLDPQISDAELANRYSLSDTRDWKLQDARKALRTTNDLMQSIVPCLYRPFDVRFCLYGHYLMDWPRKAELSHALFDNLCLATGRQGQAVGGAEWNLLTVGRYVADTNLFYRGGIQYFPLYLYPQTEIEKRTGASRSPNLAPSFIKEFAERLGMEFINDGKGDRTKTFGPEDIFDYMYTVFHSPTYRSRYAEFLKIDFPRLPLTSNAKLLRELCAIGSELVVLHLMESVETPRRGVSTAYPIAGDSKVENVRYTEPGQHSESGRVWINKTQYFEGIPPEVWNFHVGGYQVCQKWLKDRKGRPLTYDDLTHYQRIVAVLAETMRLMGEIDAVIEKHGGWPVK